MEFTTSLELIHGKLFQMLFFLIYGGLNFQLLAQVKLQYKEIDKRCVNLLLKNDTM